MNEIKREEFAKNFICDRETYFQMKADQKAIVEEVHSGAGWAEHRKALDAWWAKRPDGDRSEWKKEEPVTPWVVTIAGDTTRRRAMNIVYGIVKGKPYKKIEQKYREGNEPPVNAIRTCCEHYGVNPTTVWEAING